MRVCGVANEKWAVSGPGGGERWVAALLEWRVGGDAGLRRRRREVGGRRAGGAASGGSRHCWSGGWAVMRVCGVADEKWAVGGPGGRRAVGRGAAGVEGGRQCGTQAVRGVVDGGWAVMRVAGGPGVEGGRQCGSGGWATVRDASGPRRRRRRVGGGVGRGRSVASQTRSGRRRRAGRCGSGGWATVRDASGPRRRRRRVGGGAGGGGGVGRPKVGQQPM